jgi:hypothetical protein
LTSVEDKDLITKSAASGRYPGWTIPPRVMKSPVSNLFRLHLGWGVRSGVQSPEHDLNLNSSGEGQNMRSWFKRGLRFGTIRTAI